MNGNIFKAPLMTAEKRRAEKNKRERERRAAHRREQVRIREEGALARKKDVVELAKEAVDSVASEFHGMFPNNGKRPPTQKKPSKTEMRQRADRINRAKANTPKLKDPTEAAGRRLSRADIKEAAGIDTSDPDFERLLRVGLRAGLSGTAGRVGMPRDPYRKAVKAILASDRQSRAKKEAEDRQDGIGHQVGELGRKSSTWAHPGIDPTKPENKMLYSSPDPTDSAARAQERNAFLHAHRGVHDEVIVDGHTSASSESRSTRSIPVALRGRTIAATDAMVRYENEEQQLVVLHQELKHAKSRVIRLSDQIELAAIRHAETGAALAAAVTKGQGPEPYVGMSADLRKIT